ncbi:uncharacterized protein C8R40DRAFT_1240419 [Lentinula edodes]|uniref:uncharacterized protein n=1 Tax=Lentinula edodes TaxID=5353 RepID=UPI001E8DC852|nr:uncharacterized protein C8R40DRAFT_1240419 [Lentinula edodes]KAH7870523.1 hypothetical protein C8R40DRAFT_1240419 [Lentinula edodes]
MVNYESECPQCGYSSKTKLPPISSNSPRIAELCRTNNRPTPEEEKELRSFVEEGQSVLNHIETRIALMKASLQALENARDLLRPVVMQYKASLNPIRRLPSDILGRIFFYGVGYDKDPEEYFDFASQSLDLNSPPWVYGRVCHRWKDIIHNTPFLWTRVKIELCKIQTKTSSNLRIPLTLSLMSIYFRRSKALPLIIYLDMSSDESSLSVSNHIIYISNLILTHSWRWELLVLSGGQGIGPAAISEDTFSSLERIEIRESNSPSTSSSLDIVAPKLRAWSTVGNTWSNPVKTMPPSSFYHQITEYSISAVASSEVLKAISQLPNLRKLSVRCLLVGDDSQRSKVVLYLPKLEEFSIEQRNPLALYPALVDLLDSLSCPALIRLTVIASGIVSDAVKRFEERSNFQLQHLVVGKDAEKFVNGLLNSLVLRRILIRGDHSPSSVLLVLHEIFGMYSHKAPLPNLRELQFHWNPSLPLVDFDIMGTLYFCVHSRMKCSNALGVKPLSVFITAPDEQARRMLSHPQLRDIHSMGATVDIIAI